MRQTSESVIKPFQKNNRIGCIIMASGMGKRFGGNKLLSSFKGRAIIENILEITSTDLFDRRVVVTRCEEISKLCKEQGIECVLHTFPGRNDTVRLGLEKMLDMDACVFCPSDQPMLSLETLKRQVLAFSGDADEILRLRSGETVGTPVLFGKKYFEELCKLPEGKGGGSLIKCYSNKVHFVEVLNDLELFDIDTKEDLDFLESKCR